MEDKKIEEMMHFDDQITNKEMAGKIKKGMGITIYSKTLKLLLIIVLFALCLYFGTEKLVKMDHYNPLKDESLPLVYDNSEAENNNVNSFNVLMYIYTGLTMPGYHYEGNSTNYSDHGWANYTLEGKLYNQFEVQNEKNAYTSKVRINKSELSIDNFIMYANEFYDYEAYTDKDFLTKQMEYNKKDIEELAELPAFSTFDVSISLKKKIAISDLVALQKQYVNSDFMYAATYADNAMYLGISLFDSYGYEFEKQFNETYPDLILKQKINDEEVLLNHYQSTLKLINNHSEFKRLANTLYPVSSAIDLKEEYEKAQNNDVSILGYRVYASKDELIEMLKSDNIAYYHINDVRYSSFEK